MNLVLNVPEPDQLVDARQRRYVVFDVAQSVLPPDLLKSGSLSARLQPHQGQHLITLTSVEDDAPGEELQVIWEIEPGAYEAACHACLFLPETSCERGNKYLDRSILVPTVNRADLAFFEKISRM